MECTIKRSTIESRKPLGIAVYGDRLFTSYFPDDQARAPMFHANVRLEEAANVPGRESVRQARQQATGMQEREREQQRVDVGRGR